MSARGIAEALAGGLLTLAAADLAHAVAAMRSVRAWLAGTVRRAVGSWAGTADDAITPMDWLVSPDDEDEEAPLLADPIEAVARKFAGMAITHPERLTNSLGDDDEAVLFEIDKDLWPEEAS